MSRDQGPTDRVAWGRSRIARGGRCPDAPTIGLLLCETHSTAVVDYALQNIAKPMGVSTYRVTRELPAPIREELPSVEDLQEVVTKLRSEMDRQERQDE